MFNNSDKNLKKMKICVASSTGGHLIEVRALSQVYEKYDHFYFTFSGGVAEELKKDKRVYDIPNIVRQNPFTWIVGAILSFCIALRERPDVIITTGAGIVVFFCVFSKIFGAKLIFIESMARIKRPTLTARILYPFSDIFFVQWKYLLSYFPNAQYIGRVF